MASNQKMNTHFNFLLSSITIILTTVTPPTTSTTTTTTTAPYNLSTLLNTLGFHDISVATTTITTTTNTTTTIFSPTDVSLRSCPYCSLPLLLLEHSVTGLYPFHRLTTFTTGTKIQTLASTTTTNLCLTLTKSTPPNATAPPTVFVGGVEITRPDLFNDGNLIVHGIQGYLAHLSPLSCQIERMTSLSFPATAPPSTAVRRLLTDAIYRLRLRGYSVAALLIQQNLDLLLRLSTMTVFAVDDGGVFLDGSMFVSNFRFHIVPNRRLTGSELIDLPADSELPTMAAGDVLVVTVAGGGGLLSPMRINNVRITSTDVVCNEGIVVHGIAEPLVRVRRTAVGSWPEKTDGGFPVGRM